MLRPLLLAALLASTTLAIGQRAAPALVITKQNDTLSLWIDQIGTHSIRFKRTTGQAEQETMAAANISKITAADGSRYIGAIVTVDRTPVNIEVEHTLDSSFLVFGRDTVLLTVEYLHPKMSLYSFTDKEKQHFFAEAPGLPLTELYHRRYRTTGSDLSLDDLEYMRQMQRWMADCPDIAGTLVDLSYTAGALKKAVGAYDNSCGSTARAVFESKTVKEKLLVSILAGGFYPGIQVRTSGPAGASFDLSNPIKSQYSFSGGLGFEYFLSPNTRKLSLLGSITWNQAKGTETEYLEYGSPGAYTLRTVTIDYSSVHIDLMARYSFAAGGQWRPYIDAGAVFGAVLSSNNSSTTDQYYDNAHHSSSVDPFSGSFNSFQAGFVAGAGVQFKRIGLDYRYVRILNIASIQATTIGLSGQQVCLSFQLGR